MKILDFKTIEKNVGESLGQSSWQTITQDMINQFADLTGDDQWIHVDTEKAKLSPFGSTIAHGFMVLSFAPKLVSELIELKGIRLGLNYGFEKVRFISPIPVNSEVRMSATLTKVERDETKVKATMTIVFELKGNSEKPAIVAEWLNVFM
jgi:acyl dehydratase